jgi:hypothetical protein
LAKYRNLRGIYIEYPQQVPSDIGHLLPDCCEHRHSTHRGSNQANPRSSARERVEAVLREAYDKFQNVTNEKNADCIPYLAHVDCKPCGIAIVSTDNQTFQLGDVKYSFSIQSISKVYSLALAMEEIRSATSFESVDVYTKQCSVGVNALQLCPHGGPPSRTVASIPRLGLPRATHAVLAMRFAHFVIHAGFQAGKSGAAYSGTSEVAQSVWIHQITKNGLAKGRRSYMP